MVTVGAVRELKLHAAGDDAQANATIPVLFNATLISMHGARMLFSGLERQGPQNDPKALTYMQEWAVEVMVQPRPAPVNALTLSPAQPPGMSARSTPSSRCFGLPIRTSVP